MQWPFIFSRFLYLESNEYGIIYENITESWCRCFVLISLPWSSLYHCSSKVLVFLVFGMRSTQCWPETYGGVNSTDKFAASPPSPPFPWKLVLQVHHLLWRCVICHWLQHCWGWGRVGPIFVSPLSSVICRWKWTFNLIDRVSKNSSPYRFGQD